MTWKLNLTKDHHNNIFLLIKGLST